MYEFFTTTNLGLALLIIGQVGAHDMSDRIGLCHVIGVIGPHEDVISTVVFGDELQLLVREHNRVEEEALEIVGRNLAGRQGSDRLSQALLLRHGCVLERAAGVHHQILRC